MLSLDELVELTSIFAEEGIDKIRLTGGEPTVRKDILDVVRKLSVIPGIRTVAMTTNAIALHRKLVDLRNAGLSVLNISLDTLDEDKFVLITRRKGLSAVLKSLYLALDLGFTVKLNCVVMRGINDDEVLDFVSLASSLPIQVRFIEYMPFDGNNWATSRLVPSSELISQIESHLQKSLTLHLDHPSETSRNYHVEGMVGSLGFISSMSDHFCASCNRLRLMADGNLKVCLFGNSEVSLRDLIRRGASRGDIKAVIAAAVRGKKAKHDGMELLHENSTMNRPMVLIGG